MRRKRASLWMLGVTAAAVAAMALVPGWIRGGLPTEIAAKVRTCQVTVGQVEQVLAVTGIVRYEGEYAAISPATGVVKNVYVSAGDTVKAGQPLFRLDGAAQEAAVSAALAELGSYGDWAEAANASVDWSQVGQAADRWTLSGAEEAALMLKSMTVRAPADGLVQQVSVTENGGIMAGSAAVTLSGSSQTILCSMVIRDAEKLENGMRARLIKDGEAVGWATVKAVGAAQTSASTGQTVSEVSLMPDENLALPLGATIDAEIILYGQEDVTTLPLTAVTDQSTVWWVADGRCYEEPVEVLMADEVNCWVALPEGMQVVDGAAGLSNGQRVKEVKP